MTSNLIYIGDSVRFEQKNIANVSAITGLYRVINSTKEATINSNVSLAFSRLNMRFRIKQDKYYSDWYNVNEIEESANVDYSNVFVNVTKNTDIETEYVMVSVPSNWDEDVDVLTISESKLLYTQEKSNISDSSHISSYSEVSSVGRQNGLEYNKNFTYDPYALKQAEVLHDDLSYIANEIYGHSVDYVKVRSNNEKGKDFIFREWNLYNVGKEDVKCLKVLVPGNEFPDNKFNFSPFGVDYGDVFEIHIVDSYFKQIYGNGTFPQERDYLYFPLLNRMYEIKSTYLFRSFNMMPLYWKCTLVKWEDKTNIIYEDTEMIEKIRDNVKGLESAFGVEVEEESQNLLNEIQLARTEGDKDILKAYSDKRTGYETFVLEGIGSKFSTNQYDVSTIYSKFEQVKVAVEYDRKYIQEQNQNMTFTSWLYPTKVLNNTFNISATLSSEIYTLTLSSGQYPDYFKVGNTVSLYSKGTPKVLRTLMKISTISTDRTFMTCTLYDNALVPDISKLELVGRSIHRDVLVSGTSTYIKEKRDKDFTYLSNNSTGGIRISLIDNHIFTYEYFGNVYTFKLQTPMSEEKWYGMVLSTNLKNREIGFYLYERPDSMSENYLNEIYQKTIYGVADTSKNSTYNLFLVSTPLKITNIRLVKEHIEYDKHSSYLVSRNVNNSSKAILIDNATKNEGYETVS